MNAMGVFQAIAKGRRREILRLLRDREWSAGLVSERRDGTRQLFRARPEGLVDLHDFLTDFFQEGLERLKHAAEAEERSGARDAERN